jgi:hypothetical protein
MSLAEEATVAEKLSIPDIGELTFVGEENLHITPKGAEMRGWDDWHMVREFVQNALDAVGKVDLKKVDNTLIISDLGAGFDIDAFVIGGTTKDPFCTRGKFGEGLKYAICVALNKGYDLTIITKDNVLKFTRKVAKGYTIPTVHMLRYKASRPIKGTRVIISNYPGPSFRERFLFYDRGDAYRIRFIMGIDRTSVCGPTGYFHECIMDPPGAIFVKDIFVEKDETLVYSYNLVDVDLDADRNIAKRDQKDRAIAYLWFETRATDLIYELFERVGKEVKYFDSQTYEGEFIDWSYYLHSFKERLRRIKDVEKRKKIEEEYRNPWVEAVRRLEGKIIKKLCHCYFESEESRVRYYSADTYAAAARFIGRKISSLLKEWEIIPTAEQVVIMLAPKDVVEVPPRKIKERYGEEGYKVIIKWIKFMQNIVSYLGLDYRVVVGDTGSGALGACDATERKIYIMLDRFRDGFEAVMETFTHELVHAKYEMLDQESNTIEFVNKQVEILIKIQRGIIEREIPLPRDFQFELP